MDRYLVQKDGDVHEWTEKKLRKKLRGGDLSGLELVRHEHDEDWRPLHDLPIFGEEVPHTGDPRAAALRRVAKGFAWHLGIYLVITSFFFGITSIPGAIWGLFLVGHAFKAIPATWSLVREGKLLPSAGEGPRALGSGGGATALPAATPEPPAASGFDADLQEVRTLLAEREHGAPILAELDRVEQTVRDLRDKIRRLSALLREEEGEQLDQQLHRAQASLDVADDPEDRALRQRQVQVLRDRIEASTRARRTLERLEIRESLAQQQVRQLRLDLVRAQARDDTRADDLGERLEQIRIEAEAAEEVDGLLGH